MWGANCNGIISRLIHCLCEEWKLESLKSAQSLRLTAHHYCFPGHHSEAKRLYTNHTCMCTCSIRASGLWNPVVWTKLVRVYCQWANIYIYVCVCVCVFIFIRLAILQIHPNIAHPLCKTNRDDISWRWMTHYVYYIQTFRCRQHGAAIIVYTV